MKTDIDYNTTPRVPAPDYDYEEPTLEELEEWHMYGTCEATDGCIVEPDGICEHGCQSWLLVMGLI